MEVHIPPTRPSQIYAVASPNLSPPPHAASAAPAGHTTYRINPPSHLLVREDPDPGQVRHDALENWQIALMRTMSVASLA